MAALSNTLNGPATMVISGCRVLGLTLGADCEGTAVIGRLLLLLTVCHWFDFDGAACMEFTAGPAVATAGETRCDIILLVGLTNPQEGVCRIF